MNFPPFRVRVSIWISESEVDVFFRGGRCEWVDTSLLTSLRVNDCSSACPASTAECLNSST